MIFFRNFIKKVKIEKDNNFFCEAIEETTPLCIAFCGTHIPPSGSIYMVLSF